MIPAETIRSILNDAVQAPSGENVQPWRFEVQEDTATLYNKPDADQSLYNFEQRGSYISHGAVIENIAIAAAHAGLTATIEVAADGENSDLIAKIFFATGAPDTTEASLYGAIAKRATNRKTYKGGDIPANILTEIKNATDAISSARLTLITNRTDIEDIAKAAAVTDVVLLENQTVHDFFFSHVNWTLAQEQSKRSGFYIEVLELAPPVKAMFKVFRHWTIMKIFNRVGAARKGAEENSKIYASASAMGIITVQNKDKASFIAAGRALQRLWLISTAQGLSLQPLTGVLFFHQRIAAGQEGEFSTEHTAMIESAYATIRTAFGTGDGTAAMMFRIGYADEPTARSLKKSADITTH